MKKQMKMLYSKTMRLGNTVFWGVCLVQVLAGSRRSSSLYWIPKTSCYVTCFLEIVK